MGGPGSGRYYRWHGSKITVEACRQIDIREWHRRGLLRLWVFSWSWYTRDRAQEACISAQVQPGEVILIYRVRSGGAAWQAAQGQG